jgi:hypothetical protein
MAGAGNPNMVGMTKPGMALAAPAAPVAPVTPTIPSQMSTPFGGMFPNPMQTMPQINRAPEVPSAYSPMGQPAAPERPSYIETSDDLRWRQGRNLRPTNAQIPAGNLRATSGPVLPPAQRLMTQLPPVSQLPPMAQPMPAQPPVPQADIDINGQQYNDPNAPNFTATPDFGLAPWTESDLFRPNITPIAQAGTGGGKGGGAPVVTPPGGPSDPPPGTGFPPPYFGPRPPQIRPPEPPPVVPREPNINQTAADGINNSIAGATGELNYQPMNISPSGYGASQVSGNGYQAAGSTGQGYDAAQASGQGFNAANVGSTGYGATNAGSTGYGANNVQAGQIGDSDLSRYMNQYDSQVIDNTLGDMNRARQMQQQSSGASATAAGAFGGSRHALREAENNRNYYDQAAKTTSALRQAGFNNAQQMGLNDLQSTLQANLANQNANNAASQFGASAANTAGLTNAAAANRANEFGASALNQAAQQYSAQQQAANQFGAQAGNTANLANQAAFNQANQFGAQAANNSALANQASLNQARQFGAQAQNTAGLANQSSFNQANQFNATQNQNAQLANQSAGLAGSQQRLAAGRQLGDLSNLGFGMGQTLTGNLAQDGAMKQGLNQLLIDAVKNQYGQYQQSPYNSIGLLSQALGASPVPQTTNTSKTPGLFDYLTLASGM